MSTLSLFERYEKMSSFEKMANTLAEFIQTTVSTQISQVELNDLGGIEILGEMVMDLDQTHDSICSTVSAYLTEDTETIDTIISDYLAGSDYLQADDLEGFVNEDDVERLVDRAMSYRLDDMVSEEVLDDAVETVRMGLVSKVDDEVEMLKDEINRIESMWSLEKEEFLEEIRNLKEMMVQLTLPKPSIFSKLSSLLTLPSQWFKWFK